MATWDMLSFPAFPEVVGARWEPGAELRSLRTARNWAAREFSITSSRVSRSVSSMRGSFRNPGRSVKKKIHTYLKMAKP